MKIGLFDSGSGCLSVLHEAYHMLPAETEYIVYADLDHVPYGKRSREEIMEFAFAGAACLVEQGVDAIVIACNTATGVAIRALREHFKIPMVGMEPAVKPALEMGEKRVLVAATPVAVRAENLARLVERFDVNHRVDCIGLSGLVSFAEAEKFDDAEVYDYLKEELSEFNLADYSSIVLGCTHFNYFKPQFKNIFGEEIRFADGRHGTIRHLADLMGLSYYGEEKPVTIGGIEDIKEKYHTRFFISGREVVDPKQDEHWVKMLKRLEEIRYV